MANISIFNVRSCHVRNIVTTNTSLAALFWQCCDAEYKFTCLNCGSSGREGDAGVFARSDYLEDNLRNIPSPAYVAGSDTALPYVILADEAFTLKQYLMRPFPGRGRVNLPCKEQIYNYRLSRARRCIENAFGILVSRWRIFRKPIIAKIDNVERFIKAAVILHNYLRTEVPGLPKTPQRVPPGFVDTEKLDESLVPGAWRNEEVGTDVTRIGRVASNMSARAIGEIRENFANYLMSPAGAVPWQGNCIS